MSYILKENFKKTTRYLYMVEYDKTQVEVYQIAPDINTLTQASKLL